MLNLFHSKKRTTEEQLILIGCFFCACFVAPLAIYRYMQQDYLVAIIDTFVVIMLLIFSIQCYFSKCFRYFNVYAVTMLTCGSLGVIYAKGPDLLYWSYSMIAANYFFLKARHAFFFSFLTTCFAAPLLLPHLEKVQFIGVFANFVLVNIICFIYGYRSEYQNRKLLQLATQDQLTQVKNRRSLDDKLEEVLSIISRKPSAKEGALLLLDIDNFKLINDTYGHKRGDQVLIEFAKTVKSQLPKNADVFRFGGEEFVVVAVKLSQNDARELGERIRRSVEMNTRLPECSITVSVGVAEVSREDTPDTWFRRADIALYEAKSAGKNRVKVAERNALA